MISEMYCILGLNVLWTEIQSTRISYLQSLMVIYRIWFIYFYVYQEPQDGEQCDVERQVV